MKHVRLVLAACAAAVACACVAAAATGAIVPRPTYKGKDGREHIVASPFVLVHYTRTGPDHPRFMKDDNHNGVPIHVSPGAKGVGVGVAAAGGPNPAVTVVVGGPTGRIVPRVMRSRGHLQFFVTRFRSAKERANVMLIVTSGRQVGTAYQVVTQSL